MNRETPDELADHLADLLGIYDDPRCGAIEGCWCTADEDAGLHCHLDDEPGFPPHVSDCDCRVEWAPRMADRIRRAVANEAERDAPAVVVGCMTRQHVRLPHADKCYCGTVEWVNNEPRYASEVSS